MDNPGETGRRAPDTLVEACTRVEADLWASERLNELALGLATPAEQEVATEGNPVYEKWKDGILVCVLRSKGSILALIFVPSEISSAEMTRLIADEIQDVIITVIGGAWPKCPDHQHPLKAAMQAEEAVWECPTTGQRIYKIGSIGSGGLAP